MHLSTETPHPRLTSSKWPPAAAPADLRGFSHPLYLETLNALGQPIYLPKSNGWVLERPIGNTGHFDLMGNYPYLSCRNWTRLKEDLSDLRKRYVSLVAVTDPFAGVSLNELRDIFHDVVKYKPHFVNDTTQPFGSFTTTSRRANARRALRDVKIERVDEPEQYSDEWVTLYHNLISRHDIHGINAWSPESLRQQLRVPGIELFRAIHGGRTVGLDLWYVEGDVAHGHLAAFDDLGYKLKASYALKWRILEYFRSRSVAWVNLGGVPGDKTDVTQGLGYFKNGWATGTRDVYLCKSVFDQGTYNELARHKPNTGLFPRYRAGER